MFLDEPDPEAELLRREGLLRLADREDLNAIWDAVLRNVRLGGSVLSLPDLSPRFHSRVQFAITVPSSLTTLFEGGGFDLSSDDATAWAAAVVDLAVSARRVGHDRGAVSILVAAALLEARRVPLVGFAFNTWHPLEHPAQVFEAAELATNYLLRMISVPMPKRTEKIPLIGVGASGTVRREGDLVFKIARNVAAFEFGMLQEARVLTRVAQGGVASFMPRILDFLEPEATLVREYVDGPNGHDCLVAKDPELLRAGRKAHALREAYLALRDVERQIGVWFDLHPANFVWTGSGWVLVDAGPVPRIASNYYAADSFEDYLEHVWLNRLANMQKHPVRSLDWIRQ